MKPWNFLRRHAILGGLTIAVAYTLAITPIIFFLWPWSTVAVSNPIHLEIPLILPGFLAIQPQMGDADGVCYPQYSGHGNERMVRDCTERGLTPPADIKKSWTGTPEWEACYLERWQLYDKMNVAEYGSCFNARFPGGDYRISMLAYNAIAAWAFVTGYVYFQNMMFRRRAAKKKTS
ncbi:MAG: hypothetical protein AAB974_00325 [Patescibacteria group bacterium]